MATLNFDLEAARHGRWMRRFWLVVIGALLGALAAWALWVRFA